MRRRWWPASDGHSVRAYLYYANFDGSLIQQIEWISDANEYYVALKVCDFEASNGREWDCATAYGAT